LNVSIDVNLRVIHSKQDLAADEHLIEIVPKSVFHNSQNVLAQAGYYGKYVQINEVAVGNIINGTNQKTFPHEAGHTAGLRHPNEESKGFLGFFVSPQYYHLAFKLII
jgi:predicted Zn-dependent protease